MHRFWVIGGEYTDVDFRTLAETSPTVAGPFDTQQEATETWRQLSAATSSLACTRYSILSEKFNRGG